MSTGLRTFDTDGTIKLTQDKQLCRLVWTRTVGAGSSGSHQVNIADYRNVTVVAIPLQGDANMRHFGHQVSINSSGVVTWTASSLPTISTGFTTQRAYPLHSSTMIQVFGYG